MTSTPGDTDSTQIFRYPIILKPPKSRQSAAQPPSLAPLSSLKEKKIVIIKKKNIITTTTHTTIAQPHTTGASTNPMNTPLVITSSQVLIDPEKLLEGTIRGPKEGPGNLSTQSPYERRLIRKFCLLPPPESPPADLTDNKSIVAETSNKIAAAPSKKFLRPIITEAPTPILMPKLTAVCYNQTLDREERHIVFPPRKIVLSNASTQTDPKEFDESIEKNERKVSSSTLSKGKRHISTTSSTADDIPKKLRKRDFVINPESGILELLINENYSMPPETKIQQENPLLLQERNPLLSSMNPFNQEIVDKARQDFENCLKPDCFGNLPLHRAVISGDPSSIARQSIVLLGCGHSIDTRNSYCLTPLHLALIHACPKISVSKLLSFGADVHLKDNKENTVIHLAVLYATSDCLQVLLSHSNKLINQLNDNGFSALHLAVMDGKAEHVKMLVEDPSIDINLQDARSGRTALFHALESNYPDLAVVLAQNGCDKDVTNFAGQNIMSLASENENVRSIVQEIASMNKKEKRKQNKDSKD